MNDVTQFDLGTVLPKNFYESKQFKEKNTGNYIGVSFLIKNTLILIVTFSYFYFYKFLNKAKDTIKKSEKKLEQTNHNATNKTPDSNEMVDNLDRFLEDDEINR